MLQQILKNKIFGYISTRYLTQLISFISSIYIAVKLGPYYFGIWAFFLLLINILGNFHFGIANSINILLVQNKEDQIKCNEYIYNSFILVFLSCLLPIFVLCYNFLFNIPFFEKYHLGNLIFAIVLIVIFGYINSLFCNIFRAKNRILEIAINQSITPLLVFISIFFANGRTLLIILSLIYVFAAMISTYLYYRVKLITIKGKFDKVLSTEILKKGIFLFIYNTSFYFIVLSTKTLISYNYTVEEFGYFAFAFSLANASLLLIDNFMFLIFPKMIDMLKGKDLVKIKSKIDFIRDNYIISVQIIIYSLIPVFFIFIKFFKQYQNSYSPLILIMLTLLLYTNCSGYNTYLLANNYEKKSALFSSGALILNILSVFFLIKFCNVSFQYCILGTAISYFIYTLIVIFYSLKTLNIKSKKTIIKELIPLNIFLPLILALILGIKGNIHVTWFPLFLYITFNFNKIKSIIKNIKVLIVNPNAINVR